MLVDRGDESRPTAVPGETADSTALREGVAIPRGARNQELAQGFLRFLVETKQAAPGEIAPELPDAENPISGRSRPTSSAQLSSTARTSSGRRGDRLRLWMIPARHATG